VDIQFNSVLFGFCDIVAHNIRSSSELQSTYHRNHEHEMFRSASKQPHQWWINEVTTWKWQADEDSIVMVIRSVWARHDEWSRQRL